MRYYQYQHTHAVRRHMCGLQTPTADKVIKKLLQNDFHEHLFISLELLHYQLWKLKGILFHTATEKRDGMVWCFCHSQFSSILYGAKFLYTTRSRPDRIIENSQTLKQQTVERENYLE